jgi:A/G-specific adenine glycosylase
LTDFARLLIDWYDKNARDLPWRLEKDPYRIWLSEIMLQQTRADTVIRYYISFLERFPTVEALAGADPVEVLKLWEGLGYYSRARNLLKAARQVAEAGGFPRDAKGLRKLPGIGEYTAGAIASIAFGLPEPAIDGNQIRVLSRAFGVRVNAASPEGKRALREAALAAIPPERPGDFNQAMMGLGALICTPRPDCDNCPVRGECDAFRAGDAQALPVLPPKASKRDERRAVAMVFREDAVLVRRRPDEGLLPGLYEFPSFPGARTPAEVREGLREIGVEPESLTQAGSARHVFTHLVWQMEGWTAEAKSAGEGEFVGAEALKALPFPTALRAFREKTLEVLEERARAGAGRHPDEDTQPRP